MISLQPDFIHLDFISWLTKDNMVRGNTNLEDEVNCIIMFKIIQHTRHLQTCLWQEIIATSRVPCQIFLCANEKVGLQYVSQKYKQYNDIVVNLDFW